MNRNFFFIFVFLFCGQLIFAQNNPRDTVMWYVGKWKDNKTFLIDSSLSGSGGNGGTVIVQTDGNLKVNTPDNKKWNEKIDEQMKEIDKDEQNVKDEIRQEQGLIQYNLGKETMNELEKVKEQIKGYKAEKTKEEEEAEANKKFLN